MVQVSSDLTIAGSESETISNIVNSKKNIFQEKYQKVSILLVRKTIGLARLIRSLCCKQDA